MTFNNTRVIAVTGGKGGIGKTNIALNLAIALGAMSQEVVLLDADLGLANVDVLLGLRPKNSLDDLVKNNISIEDLLITGPNNIKIIPSGSGNDSMVNLNYQQIYSLIKNIGNYRDRPNFLIIDTAAGINTSVTGFTMVANDICIVVCNEPTSIADAYSLIKLLNKKFKANKFRIIANKVTSIEEGQEVFAKLTKVTDKFLEVSLQLVGAVPMDKYMKRAILKRKSVVCEYPNAKSTIAIYGIANKILNWPKPDLITGDLQFYDCIGHGIY